MTNNPTVEHNVFCLKHLPLSENLVLKELDPNEEEQIFGTSGVFTPILCEDRGYHAHRFNEVRM